jgi:hypothetical protein
VYVTSLTKAIIIAITAIFFQCTIKYIKTATLRDKLKNVMPTKTAFRED